MQKRLTRQQRVGIPQILKLFQFAFAYLHHA